jgi:hypothetical protein
MEYGREAQRKKSADAGNYGTWIETEREPQIFGTRIGGGKARKSAEAAASAASATKQEPQTTTNGNVIN